MLRVSLSSPSRTRLDQTSLVVLALAITFLSAGCHRHRARITPPVYPPQPAPAASAPTAPVGHFEEGIASWYGHPYHGRQTANGEIYDMYKISAAHRTLPFNTRVLVHDLKNGREVEVRINDRGPFVEGRIIDLSYAAAQFIHMEGIAPVRLEILGLATDPDLLPGIFAVQVGAFRDRSNAERLKETISRQYGPVSIQEFDRGDYIFHRVRVGAEKTEAAALDLARNLREANLATETFVVRVD